eukprot:8684925-Karenia_brevis.AAC.1
MANQNRVVQWDQSGAGGARGVSQLQAPNLALPITSGQKIQYGPMGPVVTQAGEFAIYGPMGASSSNPLSPDKQQLRRE